MDTDTTCTIESLTKQLEVNMKMLSLTSKSVVKVITRNKLKEIEKTQKILEEQKEEVESFKFRIQTLMFKEEKTEDEVSKYGDDIDAGLEIFNVKIDELQNAIEKIKEEDVRRAKKSCAEDEERRLRIRYDEEKEIEEMKLQLKSNYEENIPNKPHFD